MRYRTVEHSLYRQDFEAAEAEIKLFSPMATVPCYEFVGDGTVKLDADVPSGYIEDYCWTAFALIAALLICGGNLSVCTFLARTHRTMGVEGLGGGHRPLL